MLPSKIQHRICLLLLALAVAGCGGNASPQAPSSQIVARVNGKDISVHQLNNQLSRMPVVDGANIEEVRKQALEQLVVQELLIQQALALKLDRDPKTMLALEAARRDVLSQAYLERSAATAAAPQQSLSAAEVTKFYQDNPALFSQRRIYDYREVAIKQPFEKRDELMQVIAAATTIDEVEQWLATAGIAYQAKDQITPAEQLPMEMLQGFAAMSNDEVALFNASNELRLVYLKDATSQPISEAIAKPLIERYLGANRYQQSAEQEIARLKAQAQIEYLGSGQALGQAADAPQPAVSNERDVIEKGAAGLR